MNSKKVSTPLQPQGYFFGGVDPRILKPRITKFQPFQLFPGQMVPKTQKGAKN